MPNLVALQRYQILIIKIYSFSCQEGTTPISISINHLTWTDNFRLIYKSAWRITFIIAMLLQGKDTLCSVKHKLILYTSTNKPRHKRSVWAITDVHVYILPWNTYYVYSPKGYF